MSKPKLATARSGWGGRGYRIPGRGETIPPAPGSKAKPKFIQKVYPSVTTILNQVAKPGLVQWAADQTAAFAVTNIGHLMTRSDEVGWSYLRFRWSMKADLDDPLRSYFNGVVNDAAELGTNMHEWVEADIDGLMPYPVPMAVETEQMIEAWLEWKSMHDIRSHNAEFTVVNDTIGWAGTADADWEICCMHDGPTCLGQAAGAYIRALIDVKTARNTWKEHGYQLGGLAMGEVMMREVSEGTPGAQKHEWTEQGVKHVDWWVEEEMPEFEAFGLLHIRPNDLDSKGNIIPAFCELKDRTAKMHIYRKGFMGAYALAEAEFEEKAWNKAHAYEETEEFDV